MGHRRFRGWDGLGLGDVNLAIAADACSGTQGALNVILLASLAALAVITLQSSTTGRLVKSDTRLPFASILAPAIWLVWFAGQYQVRTSTSLYL